MELSKYHCMIGKSEVVPFWGRRGRKGKDSEKGLCFLIKVRCRTDFVSLKEHASFSPSVVLSSIGGSVEVP